MAITYAFPTSATRAGARNLNGMHRHAKQQDLGYKLEFLISAINALNTAVSALNLAAVSAANSGATWSAFSSTPTSTLGQLSNFTA